MTDTEVLFEIYPSPIRRWMALLALVGLAAVLFALAIRDIPDLWRLIFVAIAVAVLWTGNNLRNSTLRGLVLTKKGLATNDGLMLAPLENIEKVERGVFAFKPSNGFLVKLKTSGENSWALGLWWKFGRNLGVGGTLSRGQSRNMADLMTALILERDGKV